MKNRILMIFMAMLLPISGWAQSYITNSDNTITITGNDAAYLLVEFIPTTINGHPVTGIAAQAYYNKNTMISITIPASVTNIGEGAFTYCSVLTNINVSADNPSFTSTNGILFNKDLTKLIVCPEGFVGSVAIPDSVTNISDGGFRDCPGLKSVTMGDHVTYLGNKAFSECAGLANVVIGNNVPNIGDTTFYHCESLTNATIGNSVTNIGQMAFYYCRHLGNVVIGNHVSNISDSAFYDCEGLTNVTMPVSLTNIGNIAFGECISLTNVTIPDRVINLGDLAFEGCISLRQLYFQGNAPTVSGGAGTANATLFGGVPGTVNYLPGTTGWGATFGGRPTVPWYQCQPQILGADHGLGAQSNRFQFTISWATNTSVVVDASADLQNWVPVTTNTLIAGTNAFSDSDWTTYPQRFYRVRPQ